MNTIRAILFLLLLASCPSRALTTSENLRMLASDANSAALLFLDPEEDADLLATVAEIADTVSDVATTLEEGADYTSVGGLLTEIDKILALQDLNPKVRGALQLLRSRLALIAPPAA